jgi:hypothetical protein
MQSWQLMAPLLISWPLDWSNQGNWIRNLQPLSASLTARPRGGGGGGASSAFTTACVSLSYPNGSLSYQLCVANVRGCPRTTRVPRRLGRDKVLITAVATSMIHPPVPARNFPSCSSYRLRRDRQVYFHPKPQLAGEAMVREGKSRASLLSADLPRAQCIQFR